jgi:carbonic anhydrase
MYTGYKLNKLEIYRSIYAQGSDRFTPFIVTVISIITFNLLAGILIGLAISLFYILKSSSETRINIIKEIYPNGEISRLVLPQQVTFLNKAPLIEELNSIPKDSKVIIDARYAQYIDKEILELLKEFKDKLAPGKHISLNLIGFKDRYEIHDYVEFISVTTYDVQSNLTPLEVLHILREGNQRFLNDTRINRPTQLDITYTAKTQHPIAVVLGCIDSRVPVETIFDMSFGDIFCVRIAGTVINDDILASIEYACHVAGAKLIVVLGHSRCGAIQSACDRVEEGHITQLLAKIKPAISAETTTKIDRNGQNKIFVNQVTQLNIANTLGSIFKQSNIVRTMIEEDKIAMVGAIYEVDSGKVNYKTYTEELTLLDIKDITKLTVKLDQILKVGITE